MTRPPWATSVFWTRRRRFHRLFAPVVVKSHHRFGLMVPATEQIAAAGIWDLGEFTRDWFTGKTAHWLEFLKGERANVKSYLEIGSFEGRSALFAAWLFPNAHITCIDTFEGGTDHEDDGSSEAVSAILAAMERMFDANTAQHLSRMAKMKAYSIEALWKLQRDQASFDVIYIDGSHKYRDVLIDSLLAWDLLRIGGYLIWDDYFWSRRQTEIGSRLAIDQFIDALEPHIEPVFASHQVAIRKRSHVD
jgi:predicted O-methyltransferase YrrM